MEKRKPDVIARSLQFFALFLIVGVGAILFILFTHSKPEAVARERGSHPQTPQGYSVACFSIPDSVSFAGELVPLEHTDVRESLERELYSVAFFHSQTIQNIKRSGRYFPTIDSILAKNNIPLDFRYLAVAESNLDNLTSPAGAQGIWQFMKTTATRYELEVTEEVDERYNLLKATEAACRYLSNSYKKYKNWAMVAAAYNCGEGNLNEVVEYQKQTSYYDLLLNPETARYVYRIVAIKLIFENPQQYGFHIGPEDLYEPYAVKPVTVDTSITNLAAFAISQGTNYKIIKTLNPWLRAKTLTNKTKKQYTILLPANNGRY